MDMQAQPRKSLDFVLTRHTGPSNAKGHLEAPKFAEVNATSQVVKPPFEWCHAELEPLEPLRAMLLEAQNQGRFHPNPSLPF